MRESVRVVGLITPCNVPIAIPALLLGDSVVLKPASLVLGSACALADILHRAGLPAGVFNLVKGGGSVEGQALLDDLRVGISSTGSVGTGKQVVAVRGTAPDGDERHEPLRRAGRRRA